MYPEAYIEYLIHFHASRDWFECHEILEEYWKAHPDDPGSRTWVGLIQVAVGLYHHRRGNVAGALKMVAASMRNMDDRHLSGLGIDAESFRRELEKRRELLSAPGNPPFTDLNIPLADARLVEICRSRCKKRGFEWGRPSDPNDRYIWHKHMLRDRSGVIEARYREVEKRRGPS